MVMDTPDFATITNRQQQAWSTGDFNAIAPLVMPVSEALCAALDPRPNQKVLDIACGSGNAALIAARRHSDVTGLDFAPNLLERARRRAEAEGTRIEFIEGDAQALPFPDASFDVAMSTFGIMFAPDQGKAAAEILRVTKPGARIGLANWMPEGFGGEFFKMLSRFNPPPPGVQPPSRWGTEQGLQQLLGPGTSEIRIERRHFNQYFRSLNHAVEIFFHSFGPIIKLQEMLPPEKRSELRAEVTDFLSRQNRASDGTLMLHSDYMQAVATRK
jgi:SAM-dependent methyltransferase